MPQFQPSLSASRTSSDDCFRLCTGAVSRTVLFFLASTSTRSRANIQVGHTVQLKRQLKRLTSHDRPLLKGTTKVEEVSAKLGHVPSGIMVAIGGVPEAELEAKKMKIEQKSTSRRVHNCALFPLPSFQQECSPSSENIHPGTTLPAVGCAGVRMAINKIESRPGVGERYRKKSVTSSPTLHTDCHFSFACILGISTHTHITIYKKD